MGVCGAAGVACAAWGEDAWTPLTGGGPCCSSSTITLGNSGPRLSIDMRRPGPPLTFDEVRRLPQDGTSALDLDVWKADEGSAAPSCDGLCNREGCCCCL